MVYVILINNFFRIWVRVRVRVIYSARGSMLHTLIICLCGLTLQSHAVDMKAAACHKSFFYCFFLSET
jgi:hypothetical protein